MGLAIRFGHVGERMAGLLQSRKMIAVAENVGYPLDRLGIKGKGGKEHGRKKDFTEDTKAKGK